MKTPKPTVKARSCDLFFLQCQYENLPLPQRNIRVIESICEKSRHLCDFVWLEAKIVLEVRVFSRGDSGLKRQIQRDYWKIAHLQSQGFRVYFADADQIRRGHAARWISEALRSC